MSHQINLFNPALRKTAVVLPARQMLIGWGACAALMLAFYGWQLVQGNRLAGSDQESATRVQQLQAEVATLGTQISARKPSPELQAQYQRKLGLLAAREDVVQLLRGGSLGNTEGHADYLRAFARHWLEGLWLTGLTVVGAGNDIVVEGRTLKPELVPDYLSRLGREPVLKGHPFNRLQMRRPEPEPQGAGKPPLQPRFVEFSVATEGEPASVVIGGQAVKGAWARYAAKLDAMAGRERVMVFVAGALLIALAIWLIAVQPLWDRNHRLAAQAAAQRDNVATLEAQKRELQSRLGAGPDAELARRIEEADRQLQSLETSLTQMQSGLIEPGRMPALIKGMVGRTPRLQLVAMRTLPATPLVDRSADQTATDTAKSGNDGKGASDAGIYKHGIEITLEGRYLDLLAYATQLEEMPNRVMWNRTRIDAHDFPRVTMTLTLYTLSLERTWLTI